MRIVVVVTQAMGAGWAGRTFDRADDSASFLPALPRESVCPSKRTFAIHEWRFIMLNTSSRTGRLTCRSVALLVSNTTYRSPRVGSVSESGLPSQSKML